MKFDRASPIPLYYQLAEWIREQIRQGRWKPGDQLPSERELSEQAGISRMTVRQALAYLVRDGTLVVRQGLGTFVAEPKLTYDALHLIGFTEHMLRQGWEASSQVLEQAVVMPPSQVAAGLQLEPHETAVKLVRLRLSGGVPLLLETIHVPSALCPALEKEDLSTSSLYALLERKYELRLKRSSEALEVTVANEYESELFGVRTGLPMILVEGVTYLESGRPVEHFKAVYRGDRFKFHVDSERNDGVADAWAGQQLRVVLTEQR